MSAIVMVDAGAMDEVTSMRGNTLLWNIFNIEGSVDSCRPIYLFKLLWKIFIF